jgi:hypothetical protein
LQLYSGVRSEVVSHLNVVIWDKAEVVHLPTVPPTPTWVETTEVGSNVTPGSFTPGWTVQLQVSSDTVDPSTLEGSQKAQISVATRAW